MSAYARDLQGAVVALQSYVTAPPSLVAPINEAIAKPSPVDKIVGAYEALKGHMDGKEVPTSDEEGAPTELETLDASGYAVLAACAEQIVLHNFHMKASEALGVRDAAIARLEALA